MTVPIEVRARYVRTEQLTVSTAQGGADGIRFKQVQRRFNLRSPRAVLTLCVLRTLRVVTTQEAGQSGPAKPAGSCLDGLTGRIEGEKSPWNGMFGTVATRRTVEKGGIIRVTPLVRRNGDG